MSRRSAPFGARVLGRPDQSVRALRLRVQLLLTVMLVSTNVIAAGVVFLIASFVVPAPGPTSAMVLALAIAVPTYVGVAVAVGVAVGTRLSLRALRWATLGREPDVRQRLAALRVPLWLTVMQGALWLGATVLFTTLALTLQPERALGSGVAVGIAGLVACGIAFLLADFVMRPISARALDGLAVTDRPRGAGVGGRMVLFWCLGTAAPVGGMVVASVVGLAGDDNARERLPFTVLAISAVVLVFGLLTTVLNARSIVAPVTSVREALLDVERGDLDREVVVFDGTELGSLQAGFNAMAQGLREREQLRDLFGRHVGRDVALAAAARGVELGGESREVSVLFVDLVGSTTYATRHDPAEVVRTLNRFFGVVVEEVDRQHGLVNKFIGDAVLAVFGAPVDHPDHATAALAAARAIVRRLVEEVPEITAGIGVATGEAVAGNVGAASRLEYTVIGDAVNSAARLTDLAKEVPGCVLAAWDSVEAAAPEEARRWRRHDPVVLRGRSEETETAVLCG
ncbi:adenylate/guanylate cyclase domain-containing protein [Nocardioides marmotae]|uniref:HAMP domain-containing protein n=1 Tax=Nocardioides marmotae TaxID=2663857 RepID=A0A6I3JA61_9ACTN|nr:adenylate/guanylate cyclase domain-containing protein [Nocardioides marmotae]MCR6029905.1 HAMP domain-containing protein [Gordonia jinghuaiqii]MBC9732861.1 adenylate/guanylate cyclase domain-containing protein [Nocardioides marmotae]MTB83975.1 HAMP domain-containing protein [Nocardioides marmotae]MTB93535.1 HAMP domain-containing protein [Nocardioides marmotae]QKD99906.1 adenylate/guanylate cyclase domain-containing protein [Nocardioides marmotae]